LFVEKILRLYIFPARITGKVDPADQVLLSFMIGFPGNLPELQAKNQQYNLFYFIYLPAT
jgi:hypothetical protein